RHPDLPWALYEIGDRYEGVGKYEEAEKVYQRVIQGYPDSKFATDARLRIQKKRVISCIDSGDEAGAKAALNKLTVDLSQHPGLPWALYEIGYTYGRVRKYEDAKRIYQEIIEKYPDNDYAIKAQLEIPKDVVLSYIDLGDNTRAEETFDKLIADFSEHPDLPRAIDNIEEGYYNKILAANPPLNRDQSKIKKVEVKEQSRQDVSLSKPFPGEDYFKNPLRVWEKVIRKFPDFFFDDADLYYFIANCYYRLGEYEKAAQCYQKVVDNWSDYSSAGNAQFLIGFGYEKLKTLGAISGSEANPKIKEAYERLLEKYPDCKAAKAARRWLNPPNPK
ncbi:tetratricopeptide repeat protein, partial [candidate division WOR-3 bacterium]|nr:tetratricopeptide repeat protein [candidate division WOR-3 bacterium]